MTKPQNSLSQLIVIPLIIWMERICMSCNRPVTVMLKSGLTLQYDNFEEQKICVDCYIVKYLKKLRTVKQLDHDMRKEKKKKRRQSINLNFE